MHHDNILDFGERGWLVIDPKRLHGERAFDYANIFCNPDLADPRPPVAIVPGCFDRRFALITTRPPGTPPSAAMDRGLVRPVGRLVHGRRR